MITKALIKNFLDFFKSDIFSNKLTLILFLAISISVVFRWFYLINEYSVNVLFYDHWDLYSIFFKKAGLWELYSLQHGPHRQGIGFILTKYIDHLSGWNTNWISNTIGILITISSIVYLIIKKKIFGKITLIDLAIIFIILTPSQYGVFANTPNISHGAMPVLLVSLFCLSMLLENVKIQVLLMVVLNFLIIYSGFGMLFGLICPVLFMLNAFYFKNNNSKLTYYLAGLILSCLSMLLFFYNYKHAPANPNFQFPHDKPWEYLIFISKMTKNATGIPKGLGDVISYLIILFQSYILIDQLRAIVKKSSRNLNLSLIIIALITFSLAFQFATAVGRVSFGVHVASASRYAVYVITGFIGAYFYVLNKYELNFAQLIIVAFFMFFSFLTKYSMADMKQYKESKENWVRVYKSTGSIDSANNYSFFPIYPGQYQNTQLKEKLEYLKANKLNLFLDN